MIAVDGPAPGVRPKDLLSLGDLTRAEVESIWRDAEAGGGAPLPGGGTVACAFEGHGARTRSAFAQALRRLGLHATDLPGLLRTAERPSDLAAYLDPLHVAYVVRDPDHARLAAFARASARPVVNAMSALEHPCEVLADAFFVHSRLRPLAQARVCLWGPTTNVFRSWHALAALFGVRLLQVVRPLPDDLPDHVDGVEAPDRPVDLVVTDAPPADAAPGTWTPLTPRHLAALGQPALLPTPPFGIGRELAFDPVTAPGFVGHAQKQLLLPVQQALLRHLLTKTPA